MENLLQISLQTPIGHLIIRGNENYIFEISFAENPIITSESLPNLLSICQSQFIEYFEKKRTTFNFPIQLVGTDFQKETWQKLSEIPYGKTISYKTLAHRLGDVKKIRAAASANGKNPISIVIPCHRVIGADGSMTGYAAGIWRKKWLLEHEEAIKKQANQLSLF